MKRRKRYFCRSVSLTTEILLLRSHYLFDNNHWERFHYVALVLHFLDSGPVMPFCSCRKRIRKRIRKLVNLVHKLRAYSDPLTRRYVFRCVPVCFCVWVPYCSTSAHTCMNCWHNVVHWGSINIFALGFTEQSRSWSLFHEEMCLQSQFWWKLCGLCSPTALPDSYNDSPAPI